MAIPLTQPIAPGGTSMLTALIGALLVYVVILILTSVIGGIVAVIILNRLFR